MAKSKPAMILDIVSTTGEKITSLKLSKQKWQAIQQLAVERFINDAIRGYLERHNT